MGRGTRDLSILEEGHLCPDSEADLRAECVPPSLGWKQFTQPLLMKYLTNK